MEGNGIMLEQAAIAAHLPCWIEVDLRAIRHNVREIRRLLRPSCHFMAVVKDEAYGHGAVAVARAALDAGADWLGVARVREGVQLREAGIKAPILVLGAPAPMEIPTIVERELRPSVVSIEQAEILSREAAASGHTVPVHLKLDTGINRYGVPADELRVLFRRAGELPGLQVEGLFSHFSSADRCVDPFTAHQLRLFMETRRQLEADGFKFPVVHMAGSAAILGSRDSHLDMIRLGISLYGIYPAPHLVGTTGLHPALRLCSRVARVFHVERGQSIGYGNSFVAGDRLRAALVSIGYGDGLPRSHSNRGIALVNGKRARIIGRVSMDQCVLDVTQCGDVRPGDTVVAIGVQGGDHVTCDEFAERSGTIPNEVLTTLSYRVPRVYLDGQGIVGVTYLGG